MESAAGGLTFLDTGNWKSLSVQTLTYPSPGPKGLSRSRLKAGGSRPLRIGL